MVTTHKDKAKTKKKTGKFCAMGLRAWLRALPLVL